MTRKKETVKHKKEVKAKYNRLRQKAKTILLNRHRKEYLNIIRNLNKNVVN